MIRNNRGGVITGVLVTILIIFLLITSIAVFGIGVFHKPSSFRIGFSQVTWQAYAKNNICNYVLPSNFIYRTYMPAKDPNKQVAQVFTHKENNQQIIFIRLLNHFKVNPEEISIISKKLKVTRFSFGCSIDNYSETNRGFWVTKREEGKGIVESKFIETNPNPAPKEVFFSVFYYVPFFYKSQVPESNRSLVFRGLNLIDKTQLQTDVANIYVWYGSFQNLAFNKRHDSWRHYITEVLEFPEYKNGAVALIQNKQTQATFFCLTTVPLGQSFDRKEFEDFLKTINFDNKVYDPIPEILKDAQEKGIKVREYTR